MRRQALASAPGWVVAPVSSRVVTAPRGEAGVPGGPDDALAAYVADVLELGGRFRAMASEIAREEGQTESRWYALSVFSTGGLTVSQAARRLATSRQALQKTTDALVGAGLLAFEANPDHRTSPRVGLTAEGQAVLDRISRRAAEHRQRRIPDDLVAELAPGHEVLRRLLATLDER